MTDKTLKWDTLPTEALADFCAQKQTEIAALTKEQDDAKKVLFGRLLKDNQPEIVTPFGRFYQVPKTTYIFPAEVVELKNKLTEAEETAKAEGRVEKKESYYYKYGSVKVEL